MKDILFLEIQKILHVKKKLHPRHIVIKQVIAEGIICAGTVHFFAISAG